MKKLRPAKLNLHRETLCRLSAPEIDQAVGGRPNDSSVCSPDCMVSEVRCI